jgi:hypothetical protein
MTKDELELEKLRLEVEQTQLEVERKRIEVRDAKWPYLKQPTTWISVVTTVVGLVSGSQWYGAAKQKGEVAAAASKISEHLEAANQTIDKAREETVRNEQRFAMVEQRLVETQRMLDQAGRSAAPENARLKESLTEARAASVEVRAGFSNRVAALQPVRADPAALRMIQQAAPRK